MFVLKCFCLFWINLFTCALVYVTNSGTQFANVRAGHLCWFCRAQWQDLIAFIKQSSLTFIHFVWLSTIFSWWWFGALRTTKKTHNTWSLQQHNCLYFHGLLLAFDCFASLDFLQTIKCALSWSTNWFFHRNRLVCSIVNTLK